MVREVGRNDPCPCGSGRKYKRCCSEKHRKLRRQPSRYGILESQRRGILDPIAGFVESNFMLSFDTIRYHVLRISNQIYVNWTDDPIHNGAVYDTDKCERLASLAEEQLRAIVSRYPRRLWLEAFRGMALHALYMTLGPSIRLQQLMEYIIITTFAICTYSDLEPSKPGSSDHIEDILSAGVIKKARQNFAKDLGALLGAVHALIMAQKYYRYAGKGGKVHPPEKISDNYFPSFKDFPKTGFLVLPALRFQDDKALEQAIALYESRRDQQYGLGVTGFYPKRSSIRLLDANWWSLGTSGDFPEFTQTTVDYRRISMSIVSCNYVVRPMDISDALKMLMPFANIFPDVFNVDFESFRRLCQALARFMHQETAYAKLKISRSSRDELVFTSSLSKHSIDAQSAPAQLYNLFARALFKMPKDELIKALARGLDRPDPDARRIARTFIQKFSLQTSELLFHNLIPWLFYPLDKDTMVVDLFAFQSFWELCLREVTSVKGTISNVRSKEFERQAREYLKDELNLDETQIPVAPNTDLFVGKKHYGDVDFAFIWKGFLVNLDMKSWQKNPNYLKGKFRAVDNRQQDLRWELFGKPSNVEDRGHVLLDKLRREQGRELVGVLNFLCVPHVEFVSDRYADLWYGKLEFPRVLTPSELADLLLDEEQFRRLVHSL